MLRDPSLLQPDIRAYLEAENRYAEEILAPTDGAAEDAGRRDARPHQGGRFRRAGARRAVRLQLEVSPGRPARAGRPHAARRRRVPDRARRRCAGQGRRTISSSAARRHSPDHRLEAWSADLRGSEYFTIRVRRWDTGEDLPDTLTQTGGGVVWGARFDVLLSTSRSTRTIGRSRSSAIASARRRPTTCWSTRRRTPAGSPHIGRQRQRPVLHRSPAATTRRRRSGCSISPMPTPPRAWSQPRETGVRYSVEDRGEELFILTNADGAIDFRIATAPLATPGPRALARADPAPAGRLHPVARALRRPSGAARARQRAAVDRDPRPRHRRRAQHRLRRGGLFARHGGRLRVRHHDARASPIRRRPRRPRSTTTTWRRARADPAQAPGDPVRPRSGRLRHHARLRPRRRTAPRCRSSLLHRRDLVPDGIGAAAALRLRLLRHGDAGLVHGQPAVAGRSRLRLCHRPYPRRLRQGLAAGTSTASARRRPTPSPTSSPRPSADRRAATPRPAASWPTAARPAAC